MKNLLLTLIFVTSFSCQKENNITKTPPIIFPDTIIYINYEPDLIVNSISGKINNPLCGLIGLPFDTIATISIPIEINNVSEYLVTAKNSTVLVSASNPCSNYQQRLFITPFNATDSIAIVDRNLCALLLSKGDTITNNLLFGSFALLHLTHYHICEFLDGNYLVIKKSTSDKIIYGWIQFERISDNGVQIKDCAINKTNGNSIICGQTK